MTTRFSSLAALLLATTSLAIGGCAAPSEGEGESVESLSHNSNEGEGALRADEVVKVTDSLQEEASGALKQAAEIDAKHQRPARLPVGEVDGFGVEHADLDLGPQQTKGITYDVTPKPAPTGNACWRQTRNRVGTIPSACGAGKERDGNGLCYTKCRTGFQGVGPVCWSTSSSASYTRDAGTIAKCGTGTYELAGLCYKACPAGYHEVGAVCWQNCPAALPESCGGACTAAGACTDLIVSQVASAMAIAAGVAGRDPGAIGDGAADALEAYGFAACP